MVCVKGSCSLLLFDNRQSRKGVVVVPRVGKTGHRFRNPEVIYVDAQNHQWHRFRSQKCVHYSFKSESQQQLEKFFIKGVWIHSDLIRIHDSYRYEI